MQRRPFSLRALLFDPRAPFLVAVFLVALTSIPTLRYAWWNKDYVRGWEADEIARALLGGHGFSFPGHQRWLWEMWKGDSNQFFPTAWADPVYTIIIAAAHWAFGAHAYYAIFVFVLLCSALTLIIMYRLAERFGGPWAGVFAATFVASNGLIGRAYFADITNSAFSALALVVLGLVCVRYFEIPSIRRLILMGLVTGLAILTCPAAQAFLILLPLALLLWHRTELWRALGHASVVVLLSALVIGPWTLRNYTTFGEFVLIRNGGGQAAWDGTIGTAMSFMPGITDSPLPVPWQASGPREALHKHLDKDLRIPIHHYQVDSVMAAPPPGYETMNEAQRDNLYMQRVKKFIAANPGVTAQLALAKVEVFATRLGTTGLLVFLLAIWGVIASLRDTRAWPLVLIAMSYCGPFLLVVPTYGRYRAPIEPVLAIFAGVALTDIARRLFARLPERSRVRFARGATTPR